MRTVQPGAARPAITPSPVGLDANHVETRNFGCGLAVRASAWSCLALGFWRPGGVSPGFCSDWACGSSGLLLLLVEEEAGDDGDHCNQRQQKY